MRKKISIILCSMLLLTGCSYSGYDFVDTNYSFDKAYIKMPNQEVIVVDISSWSDSEDGEQLTIKSTDGTIYLVNSVNCVLVKEKR